MNTNELRAAIERVRVSAWYALMPPTLKDDAKSVMDLAEIGRLAVEVRITIKAHDERPTDEREEAVTDAILARKSACDAFLAAREGK